MPVRREQDRFGEDSEQTPGPQRSSLLVVSPGGVGAKTEAASGNLSRRVRMKFCQTIIRTEVFPITIAYQELGSREDAIAHLRTADIWTGEDEDRVLNACGRTNGKCSLFGPHAFIWMPRKLPHSVFFPCLFHEITHATLNGLTDIGFVFDRQSIHVGDSGVDEALCYLNQFVLERIMEARKK